MSLQRLFWILHGDDDTTGTYVSYPFELLAGVLAHRSRAHRCLVVGEDLGTVTPGFRSALRDLGALGCRVLWFERTRQGDFRAPSDWARAAVASATTHDLATITGFWSGRDIALRQALGLYADAAAFERELVQRRDARTALAAALAGAGIEPAHVHDGHVPAGLCAAVHAHLARTRSALLQVQLDDVLEVAEAVNLPGTTDRQHPNWRRKLPVALEDLPTDPRFGALRALGEARNTID